MDRKNKTERILDRALEKVILLLDGGSTTKSTLRDILSKAKAELLETKVFTCRECARFDGCHACCEKDLHCYKHKTGDELACSDFVENSTLELDTVSEIVAVVMNHMKKERYNSSAK